MAKHPTGPKPTDTTTTTTTDKAPTAPTTGPQAPTEPPALTSAGKGAVYVRQAPRGPQQKKGRSTVEAPVAKAFITCMDAQVANGYRPLARHDLTVMVYNNGTAWWTARSQVDRYLRWARNGYLRREEGGDVPLHVHIPKGVCEWFRYVAQGGEPPKV